jgi:glycosyltransferase involved in cell wall biosynthesis
MNKTSTVRPYRIAVHGLPHFCQKLSELLEVDGWNVPYRSLLNPIGLAARVSDLARCDLAYSWSGRISMGKFLWVARSLGKSKIIMLWCGSDAMFAKEHLRKGFQNRWVMERVHWAVSPWLAEEVRSLGVDCEYVQTSFVAQVSPSALPERFSVLTYAPSISKAGLYGLDSIVNVAKRMPSIQFNLVGLKERRIAECPSNLHIFGHLDLDRFYRETTVLWRPVRHDGLSFMVLEALAHGRHVLYSQPLPGCIHVTSEDAACLELERLRDLHSSKSLLLHEEGRRIIARDFNAEVVRTRLLDRWEELILLPERDFGRTRLRVPS